MLAAVAAAAVAAAAVAELLLLLYVHPSPVGRFIVVPRSWVWSVRPSSPENRAPPRLGPLPCPKQLRGGDRPAAAGQSATACCLTDSQINPAG